MDKDKRELAWKKWTPEFDISANQAAAKCGFYAGYAAATAESIPQSDGWVDVADGLPTEDGWYLVTTVGGDVNMSRFRVRDGHFETVVSVLAWQPKPAPYQRQSSLKLPPSADGSIGVVEALAHKSDQTVQEN
jgi:hypothetical protein